MCTPPSTSRERGAEAIFYVRAAPQPMRACCALGALFTELPPAPRPNRPEPRGAGVLLSTSHSTVHEPGAGREGYPPSLPSGSPSAQPGLLRTRRALHGAATQPLGPGGPYARSARSSRGWEPGSKASFVAPAPQPDQACCAPSAIFSGLATPPSAVGQDGGSGGDSWSPTKFFPTSAQRGKGIKTGEKEAREKTRFLR